MLDEVVLKEEKRVSLESGPLEGRMQRSSETSAVGAESRGRPEKASRCESMCRPSDSGLCSILLELRGARMGRRGSVMGAAMSSMLHGLQRIQLKPRLHGLSSSFRKSNKPTIAKAKTISIQEPRSESFS